MVQYMAIKIIESYNTFISPSPTKSKHKYAHASVNIISVNNPFSPVIEVNGGKLSFETTHRVLFAVTGNARVKIGEKEVEAWRTYTLEPGTKVTIEGYSYVAFHGVSLNCDSETKTPIKPGDIIRCKTVNGEFNGKKLLALKVPLTMRNVNGNWKEMLRKLQRHVELAKNAAERGAELVKVRVGSVEFEMWVQELR